MTTHQETTQTHPRGTLLATESASRANPPKRPKAALQSPSGPLWRLLLYLGGLGLLTLPLFTSNAQATPKQHQQAPLHLPSLRWDAVSLLAQKPSLLTAKARPSSSITNPTRQTLAPGSYSIFDHQMAAMGILLGWGVGSMVTGTTMLLGSQPLTWGFGLQHLTWGLIDAIIALVGLVNGEHRRRHTPDFEQEQRKFRTGMMIGGLTDLLYIATGIILMVVGQLAFDPNDPNGQLMVGNGAAVLMQGSFLLAFDWISFAFTFQRHQYQ